MNEPAVVTSPTLETPSSAMDDSLEITLAAVQAALDRKGSQIRVVKVTAVSYLADYFIVISGFSPVQVKAIARAIEDAIFTQYHRHPCHQEGLGEGRWVLQDYGDVVVHVFMPSEREYYNLEAFWSHGETIDWEGLLSNE
jgi:ribosome-associated protein